MGVKVYGFDDLGLKIEEYGKRVTPLMKRAVYAGAGEIADNVRKNLNAAVSDEATGQLAGGLKIWKIQAKNGEVFTSVGFAGYDDKGQPLPTIAAVLESGRSDQPGRKKTHFFSRAVSAARASALEAMAQEANRYLDEISSK